MLAPPGAVSFGNKTIPTNLTDTVKSLWGAREGKLATISQGFVFLGRTDGMDSASNIAELPTLLRGTG